MGPCFLQQNFPRTQNPQGLCEASKMDEVPGHAPSRGVSAAAPIATDHVCACRKCRIALRAPWQQVAPLRLSDVSLMPCLAQSQMEQVPVWAISQKGDVLCRLGVSPQNPPVRTPLSLIQNAPLPPLTRRRRSSRAAPGCTWAPTSPSSPSPSVGPVRCGPSPGTGRCSTGGPCPSRTLQVRTLHWD